MPVSVSGGERRAIAGDEGLRAGIVDKRHFASENIEKLVFMRMPMTLARPRAWRQGQSVDAELRQAAGVAECFAYALSARLVERGGVLRAGSWLDALHINFRHHPLRIRSNFQYMARPGARDSNDLYGALALLSIFHQNISRRRDLGRYIVLMLLEQGGKEFIEGTRV